MQAKDYYKILDVETSASAREIKTSYRKLALKYHPDKANGNPFAETKFKEIQEAYTVLSNQKKKKEYDKHSGSTGKRSKTAAVTTQSILDSFRKLNRDLAGLDVFRMNHDSLYQKIEKLLSTGNLLLVSEERDMSMRRFIISEAIKATDPLPYKKAEKICNYLKPIALTDPASTTLMSTFLIRKKQQGYWDRYKLVAAIIIAIVLCFIIYKSTQ